MDYSWEGGTDGDTEGGSARRHELLERAYCYVLDHGLTDLSLRPLAAAVGSSPRVLLYLFGSKENLLRALLTRARVDELAVLAEVRRTTANGADLADCGRHLWQWLAAPRHRALLRLWVESYTRSLVDSGGPWAGFASQTVADWLDLLAPADRSDPAVRDDTEITLLLAVLRGALLDLLATGDEQRITAAVDAYVSRLC